MPITIPPLEPPPIFTKMFDDDGNMAQVWAKWFQNVQTLLNAIRKAIP